mgnify:FL=1
MVPVAQETTANTVRLPYSFSRRFSLVAWCEASLEILHVHPLSLSVLQELQYSLLLQPVQQVSYNSVSLPATKHL